MTGSAAPLDCARLETLEQIALLATHVFDAPMAVLRCRDGVHPPFKASVGLSAPHADLLETFCTHCAENESAAIVVQNAAEHPVLGQHPLFKGRPVSVFMPALHWWTAKGRPWAHWQ